MGKPFTIRGFLSSDGRVQGMTNNVPRLDQRMTSCGKETNSEAARLSLLEDAIIISLRFYFIICFRCPVHSIYYGNGKD